MSDDNGLWLLALGPAGASALYWALYRYYRNTDKSHAFERETDVVASRSPARTARSTRSAAPSAAASTATTSTPTGSACSASAATTAERQVVPLLPVKRGEGAEGG